PAAHASSRPGARLDEGRRDVESRGQNRPHLTFLFMRVKTFRPLTPSTRYITIAPYADVTKTEPEKSLVVTRKKTGGRNCYGRVTARGIGGGHTQKIRLGGFKRDKPGVVAPVSAIDCDPLRRARPDIPGHR